METFKQSALDLMKSKLGISSSVRDAFLFAIVDGVVDELTDVKGIALDAQNATQLMFVVDLASWRYESKATSGVLPRNLHYRLNEMILKYGGGSNATV